MTFHRPEEEHIRNCASCQRRLKFLERLGFEAVEAAGDLDMGPEETIVTVLDLVLNLAHHNDAVDVMVDHMGRIMEGMLIAKKTALAGKRPGPRKSDE